MQLTSRSRALLKVLLDSTRPMKIREAARDFRVSERTIKYDLEAIRTWLKERHVTLHSQPNKGIWISENEEKRARLRRHLEGWGRSDWVLHQKERAKHLALMLLLADGYVRLNDLADRMAVSRNTVISDLREAESFLAGWGLELISRPRYGVRIFGEERSVRFALECLLHDLLEGDEMFRLVQRVQGGAADIAAAADEAGPLVEQRLLGEEEIRLIDQAVRELMAQLSFAVTDRTLISLHIRLCILVHRVQKGKVLTADETTIQTAQGWSGYPLFAQTANRLFAALRLMVTPDELAYGCLPLLGVDYPLTAVHGSSPAPDIYDVTIRLTEAVSQAMQVPFDDDPELHEHLFAHLTDRIMRYLQGVLYPNPLTSEICRSYPRMFAAVKRACQDVLWPSGICLLDADIAYIVLHFQAAWDRWMEQKKVNVLVVCGTGRGTARFLKTQLEAELKGLRVVGLCGSLEVEKYLASRKVDLIVSVLPVKADVPVVVVNALPTRHDLEKIHDCLQTISAQPSADSAASGSGGGPRRSDLCADLHERDLPVVERLSQDVIYKGFELSQAITAAFREHLTEQAASGLMLHIMLMVNRLTFGSSYVEWQTEGEPEGEDYAAWRKTLKTLVENAGLAVPESEITAIMRYFSGKGVTDSDN
ncbi:PRD domain-containing protein [Brevibacillus sp. NL20B1]|uniref:BglG family transcription antiterminator n=1 Tax=Brevibacillus sp. NL20B1 TaxID=2829799 RepID=UPI001B9DDCFC|nr:PRD domain-containing protein [Brevibacillus sp. NL20B1]